LAFNIEDQSQGHATVNVKQPAYFPQWAIAVFLSLSLSLSVVHTALAQSADDWDGSLEQRLSGFITVWSEAKYNLPYFDQRTGLD